MPYSFMQNSIYRGASHGAQCTGKSREYNLLKSSPLIMTYLSIIISVKIVDQSGARMSW